jgi:hypothetical protein
MLPAPAPASEAPAKPLATKPRGASSPSSPGSGEEPKRNLDYLLEDEPHPGHARMYVALALLVVAGLLLGWHWHREGYPWAKGPAATSGPSTAASPASAGSAPGAATSSAPTGARESQRAVPQSGAAGTAAETAKGEAKKTPAEQPETQGAALPPASGAAEPSSPASVPPSKAAEPSVQPQETGTARSERAAEKEHAGAASPAEVASKPQASAAKPSEPELKPPATSGTYSEKLTAEGEKYLYGDGVQQNCSRAQKNLTSAAKRLNVKAQTLLGTMYATGHCANRDLPTAYRWFARALHQDPSNDRIKRDLEALWREMTPDERQAAMRNQ